MFSKSRSPFVFTDPDSPANSLRFRAHRKLACCGGILSNRFALNAIGQDRPGIVSAVTDVLYRYGCNIEDSAMTILWGQFAMILVVTPPDDLLDGLRGELQSTSEKLQLQLSLTPLDESSPAHQQEPSVPFLVSVYGADQPGIVSQTTGFLAERGINITDLSTRVIQGKGPVYIMLLEVEAPVSVTEAEFKEALYTLSQQLKVDISLRRLETEMI